MPDSLTLYHNPRCSKSRQALALLEEKGLSPRIIEYLKTPPTTDELTGLIRKLGCKAHDIIRTGEDEYTEAGLSENSPDDKILAALVKYPVLLQRPIVVKGSRAVIGRPPENILTLIKG